jgi:hypothetical protein
VSSKHLKKWKTFVNLSKQCGLSGGHEPQQDVLCRPDQGRPIPHCQRQLAASVQGAGRFAQMVGFNFPFLH